MNAYESLTDIELEAMLGRLTTRASVHGLHASIMAAVDTRPQRYDRWTRWPDWRPAASPELRVVWLLAVLALVLALAAGALVVGSRLLINAEPGGVFSWRDDNLGEWVTSEELTDALTAMSMHELRAALDGPVSDVPSGSRPPDWEWRYRVVGYVGTWRLLVHNGDHDGAYVGPPTQTDPRLPEGVTYEAESGFGHGGYILAGPNSDELLALRLLPPGASLGYPQESEVRAYEDRIFALASMMLHEMGWLD